MIVCLVVIDAASKRLKLGAQTLFKINPMNKRTVHRDISFVRRSKEGYISGTNAWCERTFSSCQRTVRYATENAENCQEICSERPVGCGALSFHGHFLSVQART